MSAKFPRGEQTHSQPSVYIILWPPTEKQERPLALDHRCLLRVELSCSTYINIKLCILHTFEIV